MSECNNINPVWLEEAVKIKPAKIIVVGCCSGIGRTIKSLEKLKRASSVFYDASMESIKSFSELEEGLAKVASVFASVGVTAEEALSGFNYKDLPKFEGGRLNGRFAGLELRREINQLKFSKSLETAGQVAKCNYNPLSKHRGKHDPCGLRQDMNLKGRKHRCMV